MKVNKRMKRLSEDEMREAWKWACEKYKGKKWSEIDIWLSRQVRDYATWIFIGNRTVDRCNVYLDEMNERHGGEDG